MWKCSNGHQWGIGYGAIQSGKGCPYCSRKVPKIEQDYIRLAELKRYKWLGPMPQRTTYITWWQCEKGHKWKACYSSIQGGNGCPYCSQKVRKTIDDYHALAANHNIKWVGIYPRSNKVKTTWECLAGHRWDSPYKLIARGHLCPYCAGNARKKPDDYHILAAQKGIKWVGETATNSETKTAWECSQGHVWETTYWIISTSTICCPQCVGNTKKTSEDYHNLALERGFIWTGSEANSVDDKTTWRCRLGHEWKTRYSVIARGCGCPQCIDSGPAERVAVLLERLGIVLEREKTFEGCKDKSYLYFDFYFWIGQRPFLVEVDGAQHSKPVKHWGGEENLLGIQRRDKIKNDFAAANNIPLIRIPYTVKNIEAYLQLELEKHLGYSLETIRLFLNG
jgi:hypothetical protein